MLFQIFSWAAHPWIFLLRSLPSTSLVHLPLQGICEAVHAALPSVLWWHPALYLLPSWPRHSCWQPQTMSGRNWFLEESQLAAAQPGQGRNNANQQGEVLWGSGEIRKCSISWGHLSGHHPKRCTMQPPRWDLTSLQPHQKIHSLFVKCLLHFERLQQLSFEFDSENCTGSLHRWPGVPLLVLFWITNGNNCKPVPRVLHIYHFIAQLIWKVSLLKVTFTDALDKTLKVIYIPPLKRSSLVILTIKQCHQVDFPQSSPRILSKWWATCIGTDNLLFKTTDASQFYLIRDK